MSDVKPSAINTTPVIPLSPVPKGNDQQTSVQVKPQNLESAESGPTVKETELVNTVSSAESVNELNQSTGQRKADPEAIDEAVADINDYVQSLQRDLHFSVDEESGLTVVRVRDKESGELIRQIPEDVFLNLAQKLKENLPIHLLDAQG